jgi:hypothetical protein
MTQKNRNSSRCPSVNFDRSDFYTIKSSWVGDKVFFVWAQKILGGAFEIISYSRRQAFSY